MLSSPLLHTPAHRLLPAFTMGGVFDNIYDFLAIFLCRIVNCTINNTTLESFGYVGTGALNLKLALKI